MPWSAYDRWKTTPPDDLPQSGDCLHCGNAGKWISGRLRLARMILTLPKSTRRRLLTALKTHVDPDQEFCAFCGSDAVRARLTFCDCGAKTAWGCVCP